MRGFQSWRSAQPPHTDCSSAPLFQTNFQCQDWLFLAVVKSIIHYSTIHGCWRHKISFHFYSSFLILEELHWAFTNGETMLLTMFSSWYSSRGLLHDWSLSILDLHCWFSCWVAVLAPKRLSPFPSTPRLSFSLDKIVLTTKSVLQGNCSPSQLPDSCTWSKYSCCPSSKSFMKKIESHCLRQTRVKHDSVHPPAPAAHPQWLLSQGALERNYTKTKLSSLVYEISSMLLRGYTQELVFVSGFIPPLQLWRIFA